MSRHCLSVQLMLARLNICMNNQKLQNTLQRLSLQVKDKRIFLTITRAQFRLIIFDQRLGKQNLEILVRNVVPQTALPKKKAYVKYKIFVHVSKIMCRNSSTAVPLYSSKGFLFLFFYILRPNTLLYHYHHFSQLFLTYHYA